MNRYLQTGDIILEVPLLAGVLCFVLVCVTIFLFLLFEDRFKQPLYLKIGLTGLISGLICLLVIAGFALTDKMGLESAPTPLPSSAEVIPYNQDSSNRSPVYRRYVLSQRLERLGFIREVYDDGKKTYFHLNSRTVPILYIENQLEQLVDQNDSMTIHAQPEHPFPILVVDRLAHVWYLQFNNYIDHIRQIPEFERSIAAKSVRVYYSNRFYSVLPVHKDTFICDQIAPHEEPAEIPHIRHYIVFDRIRYYIDHCEIDYSQALP